MVIANEQELKNYVNKYRYEFFISNFYVFRLLGLVHGYINGKRTHQFLCDTVNGPLIFNPRPGEKFIRLKQILSENDYGNYVLQWDQYENHRVENVVSSLIQNGYKIL